MKIHTGRDRDMRDVVMMSEHVDWKLVSDFAYTGLTREVIRQIENASKTIKTAQFSSVRGLEVLSTEIEN